MPTLERASMIIRFLSFFFILWTAKLDDQTHTTCSPFKKFYDWTPLLDWIAKQGQVALWNSLHKSFFKSLSRNQRHCLFPFSGLKLISSVVCCLPSAASWVRFFLRLLSFSFRYNQNWFLDTLQIQFHLKDCIWFFSWMREREKKNASRPLEWSWPVANYAFHSVHWPCSEVTDFFQDWATLFSFFFSLLRKTYCVIMWVTNCLTPSLCTFSFPLNLLEAR